MPTKDGPTPTTIHGAILAIYKEGKLYAQKASRNTGQGYNYTSEADFLALIRPQLAEHDIICFPSYVPISEELTIVRPATERDNAKLLRRVTIRGTFTFFHPPSNTSITVDTIGEGCDQQDKAPYKAMTGALKYAVRQTFQIETGDDPEADAGAPPTEPTPKSKFLEDLAVEVERIGPPRAKKLIDSMQPGYATTEALDKELTGEQKRALIAALRKEPPF